MAKDIRMRPGNKGLTVKINLWPVEKVRLANRPALDRRHGDQALDRLCRLGTVNLYEQNTISSQELSGLSCG